MKRSKSKLPRSVDELRRTWHRIMCSEHAKTAGGAAELRELEAEAEPHECSTRMRIHDAIVQDKECAIRISLPGKDNGSEAYLRDVHPLVPGPAHIAEVSRVLLLALRNADCAGNWTSAIAAGEALLAVAREAADHPARHTWGNAETSVDLGRLERVAPKLAQRLHDALPGRERRIRETLRTASAISAAARRKREA